LPEVAQTHGKDAGRVPADLLAGRAEAFLQKTFGQGEVAERWLQAKAGPWIYLNRNLLQQRGVDETRVEAALAEWLKRQAGVLTAYTRSQFLDGLPPEDTIGSRVRRAFYPARSGDVMVVLKPYYLIANPLLPGTTHGSPHPYDTHVPLLVYGPGLKPGVHAEAVTPQVAAPLFAHALGIPSPARARAPLPEGLFTSP
jgi:hypothetical protein